VDDGARPLRADAARNRERVLASAEAVPARDGLSASMRAVAAEAGVGLGTIYRNFPTQEALYQAIIIRRTRTLIAEAAGLGTAPDPGQAFFGYFTRVVEHAMRTKALADLLARAGIDPKSGMAGIGDDMRDAVGALLARAQQAGTVRPDLRMPELMAILTPRAWPPSTASGTPSCGPRPWPSCSTACARSTRPRAPATRRQPGSQDRVTRLLRASCQGSANRAGPAEHGCARSCVSTCPKQ
jgi:AcrR family transcriptional regulator